MVLTMLLIIAVGKEAGFFTMLSVGLIFTALEFNDMSHAKFKRDNLLTVMLIRGLTKTVDLFHRKDKRELN